MLQNCEKCEIPLQTIEIASRAVQFKMIGCVFCNQEINDMIRKFESGWPLEATTERKE